METDLLDKTTGADATKTAQGFVLIVDDEEQNRTLLRDALEPYRYDIEEAANGEDAMRRIAQRPPDVVLLDVMMPGLNGFEVCAALKKDANTAPIPVLMVTALSDRQERLMGIAVGANDFLQKPVDLQDLMLRVRNAVQTKRLFDQLQAEREKSERLLLNVLPGRIAQRMKQGELNIAEAHSEVGVLVADLVGFTSISAHIEPEQMLSLLNEIFSAFDLLVEKHGLEKIKTVGDAYMAAGGLAGPSAEDAHALVRLALDMLEEVHCFNLDYSTSLKLRVGVSSGPVVSGVIGRNKFAYDLWGDTVSLACQLESYGEAGTINVSQAVFDALKDSYDFEARVMEGVKGRENLAYYSMPASP